MYASRGYALVNGMNASMHYIAAKAALEFYADHGVDIGISDTQINRIQELQLPKLPEVPNFVVPQPEGVKAPEVLLGKNEARIEAVKLAQAAGSLVDLKAAIANFDGISIKKTATNLVFADGNPKAKIMVIGEAPGADEDRQGLAFIGADGQLLNKILACIGLSRGDENPLSSAYLTNVLSWRPPGNRSPNPAEIEVSLPFIERHIQLIAPSIIIICGGVAAKALLGRDESISRLRKTWHDYLLQTPELQDGALSIPALVTYHPSYLLQTPMQKRAVWEDMLMVQKRRADMKITA